MPAARPASPGPSGSPSVRDAPSKKRKLPRDAHQAPRKKKIKSTAGNGRVETVHSGESLRPKVSPVMNPNRNPRRPPQLRQATPGPSTIPTTQLHRTRSLTKAAIRRGRSLSSDFDSNRTPPPVSSLPFKKSVGHSSKPQTNAKKQSTPTKKQKALARRKSKTSTAEVIEIYDSDEVRGEGTFGRRRCSGPPISPVKRGVPSDCEVIDLCSDEEGLSPVANAPTPAHPEVERSDPAPVQPHTPLFLPDESVEISNGVHGLGSLATATVRPPPMLTNVADELNPEALQVITGSESKGYDPSLQSENEPPVDSNLMVDTETQCTPSDDTDVALVIFHLSSSNSQEPDYTTSLPVNELDRGCTPFAPSGEDVSAPVSRDRVRVEATGFLDGGDSQYTQPGSADGHSKAAPPTTPERATPDEAIISHPSVALESSSPSGYRDDVRAPSVSQEGGGASDDSPQSAIPTATTRIAIASLGITNVETFDEPKESTEASPTPSSLNRLSPAAQTTTYSNSPCMEHKDSDDVNEEVKITSDDLQLGNETRNGLDSRHDRRATHVPDTSSRNSLTHAPLGNVHGVVPPPLTIKYSDSPAFVPCLLTPRFFAQSFLPRLRQSDSSAANPEASAAVHSTRVSLADITDPTVCNNSAVLSESLIKSIPAEDGQIKPAKQTPPITSPSPSPSSLFQKADLESVKEGSPSPENNFTEAAPSSDCVAQLVGGHECASGPSSQQPILMEAAPSLPSESSHDNHTPLETPLPELTPPRAPEVHPFFIRSSSPADMLPDYTLNILDIPTLPFTDGDDDDPYLLTHCFDYPDLEVGK